MTILERFTGLSGGGTDPVEGLLLCRGTRADFAVLARHHYRPAPPATFARVLKLAPEPRSAPVAVLVVSYPTLNASWRRLAWPGRYGAGKRPSARRLNAEVRAISRVVVHPDWRGLGLASRLVRAYLARPLTRRTEALAAMAAACPLFRAAGMTEHEVPPPARDARLRREMECAGVSVDELIWLGRGPTRARIPADLERALRTWADASRATRGRARLPVRDLAILAAESLCSPRLAFTHEARARPP